MGWPASGSVGAGAGSGRDSMMVISGWRRSGPGWGPAYRGKLQASAGWSVDVALEQVAVGVDPAVAQERPDPAHVLAAPKVDLAHQHGGVFAGLGQELALRAQYMAVAPEPDARGAQRRRLVADAVAGQHRQPVGHGMAAVAEDPGVALAVLLVLGVVRVPADGGGVEQQLGAGQRHQPRRFRVPLVPAHQHAEAADRGVDRFEADVAGGEVELLVEARV